MLVDRQKAVLQIGFIKSFWNWQLQMNHAGEFQYLTGKQVFHLSSKSDLFSLSGLKFRHYEDRLLQLPF